MEFNLITWLQKQCHGFSLDVSPADISQPQANDDREWLLTNGLGSFASSNIWGANTRRYHGLLVAALEPPLKRTLMFSRVDEVVNSINISTNFWGQGVVSPEGYKQLESFTITPVPTWVYLLPGGRLIKQIVMSRAKQEIVLGYTWMGEDAARLELHTLFNFRDYHSQTRGHADWQFIQLVEQDRITARAYESALPVVLSFSRGSYHVDPRWYWNYFWPGEHARGLEDHEDNFHGGFLECELKSGESLTVRVGLESGAAAGSIHDCVRLAVAEQDLLLAQAGNPTCRDVRQLVLAADQFVVDRHSTHSKSIIAGYHWFADWGRDSMISLPGLALCTGRADVACGILQTFGQYLSQGMLPNNFPDSGMTPQYNTSDATFWWAVALWKYWKHTADKELVRQQLPLLASVVDWHKRGTRYGLKLDAGDGLITGGEPGVQLTWMDAKVGDYVVTPRQGKVVEINALWFNFLKTLQALTDATGGNGDEYQRLAEQTRAGFKKFWHEPTGCLLDVIRDDGSGDNSIRPNQLFALSLPHELLSTAQAQSVLSVVERDLLTDCGLRTLAPQDPAYQGRYGGQNECADQYARDITYHQGTVWPWLLGAWVDARYRVHGDAAENTNFIKEKLKPIRAHIMQRAGLGSISEIFDGDAPQRPVGCVAQAWSVAELLRVLHEYPQLQ